MEKMPGNIIRATAANFSDSFTGASRTIRKFARSPCRKRWPKRATFPGLSGSFRRRGSTRTSTCGSEIVRTLPRGICWAKRETFMRAQRRSGTMHGRKYYLHELRFGFGEHFFHVRVDAFPEALAALDEFEFRVTLRAAEELRVVAAVRHGKVQRLGLEKTEACLLAPQELAAVAFHKFLEIFVSQELLRGDGVRSFRLGDVLCAGGA